MPTLRNNFDTGPAGTTITAVNSGTVAGNDAFNVVSPTGSGTILRYTDAGSMGRGTATYVMETKTGATATDNGVLWSTSMGSQSQIWWREYIRPTALPASSGATSMPIFECDNGSVYMVVVHYEASSGRLEFNDDPGVAPVSILTTNSLPLNEWCRVECRIQFSTTTGNFELRLYLDPDSDTPTETISGSNLNLHAATANSFAFGSPFSVANKPTTYYSGLELNNTGWPGPAPFRLGKGFPMMNLSNPIAIHQNVM